MGKLAYGVADFEGCEGVGEVDELLPESKVECISPDERSSAGFTYFGHLLCHELRINKSQHTMHRLIRKYRRIPLRISKQLIIDLLRKPDLHKLQIRVPIANSGKVPPDVLIQAVPVADDHAETEHVEVLQHVQDQLHEVDADVVELDLQAVFYLEVFVWEEFVRWA